MPPGVRKFGPRSLEFEEESYRVLGDAPLKAKGHIGAHYHKWGSPYVVDWDGDGWMDLFETNHVKYESCETHWCARTARDRSHQPLIHSTAQALAQPRLIARDLALNRGGGWLEAETGVVKYVAGLREDGGKLPSRFDAHGGAVLDIDRDGLLDLYVAQGAVRGTDMTDQSENGLFWGTPDGRLIGGRGASKEAGLACQGCRAYNVGLLDINHDGLLDVLSLNRERNDDNKIPSRLWLNLPPSQRKFELVPEMSVFAVGAIMTDFDQVAAAQSVQDALLAHLPPWAL